MMDRTEQCPVCHTKGERLYPPTNTGWTYDVDMDPAKLWPDGSQEWRDQFVARLSREACHRCDGEGWVVRDAA